MQYFQRLSTGDLLLIVGIAYVVIGMALTMFKGLIQEAIREMEIGGLK